MLRLHWRPFGFTLPQAMVTAHGAWSERRGWLLRLEAPDGRIGWGEAAPAPAAGVAATGMVGAGRTAASGTGGGRSGSVRTGSGRSGAGRAGAGRSGGVSSAGARMGAGRAGVPGTGMPALGRIGSGLAVVPGEAAMEAAMASPQSRARAFPEQSGPWAGAVAALAPQASRAELEACLPQLPAPLAFALGAALAEIDGLVGSAEHPWRAAPPPAWLLPAGEAAVEALRAWLASHHATPEVWPIGPAAPTGSAPGGAPWLLSSPITPPLSVKWKVAAHPDPLERRVLEELLALLPPHARLRLDANGGWDRPTATAWADRLAGEPQLEWLEQPLPPGDPEGLEVLAQRIPVALDESLHADPGLRERWPGWQVRRPALEGDPRPLLAALRAGRPRLMVSTALETGIGRRWVDLLAALQAAGATPTAPGLAPGWTPTGPLFAADPAVVWEAAA